MALIYSRLRNDLIAGLIKSQQYIFSFRLMDVLAMGARFILYVENYKFTLVFWRNCRFTQVEIEIMRFFALFLTPVLKKINREWYVVDFIMGYLETSKLCDLVKNWVRYAWISEMALTMVICVAKGKSAILIK